MVLGGADVWTDNDPREALNPKAPGAEKKPKYWLKEWQWYAVFTVIGVIIMAAGFIASVAYLALAGIAIALFAVFGVIYGLLREKPS